jgi:hypothetical protein
MFQQWLVCPPCFPTPDVGAVEDAVGSSMNFNLMTVFLSLVLIVLVPFAIYTIGTKLGWKFFHEIMTAIGVRLGEDFRARFKNK